MSNLSVLSSKRVVAKEKTTQTPLSYLNAKETRVYLDKKHSEFVND